MFLLVQVFPAFAQQDQGAITGTITDPTGASVPNADVTLTNVDNGLVFTAKTDGSGNYTFSPIKIGNYKVSANAAGFSTTTQSNIRVDVQSRTEVNVKLKTGAATTTVEVNSAPPLMQTQEASTGQVMSTQTINDTPLNGRNWVFIAQLTAGVAPPSGSRGAGKGDFNANGQRAEQNNFILDGVDNNNNVVDFLNGASFIVRPPPDALAEFKIQTSTYSAEFGHSAGAVINASVKSGTNQIHGDLWEYARNDAFDVHEFFGGPTVPKYRENQFGATLGFPIIKDKLFFFGDVEANRIIFGETHSGMTVPTALMRNGDFSELLNGANNSGGTPITLYQPSATNSGTTLLTCNGRQNVMCPSQIDPVAQHLLSLFPSPNVGSPGQTYSNFTTQSNATDNTWQWDTRMDWNISAKDQIFGRFSYLHDPANHPPPLGPILDGGGFGDTGNIVNLGENFAGSETHVFSPTLVNEFRFGYNYGHFGFFHVNSTNPTIASSLGLGGIPVNTDTKNDGIPFFSISGLSNSGSPQFYASNEYENVFQILDNVTKQLGNHSLKAGVSFQRVRFSTSQPTQPRGTYTYNGTYTSQQGTSNTGFGAADFLFNTMNSSAISNVFNSDDVRWDRAAYAQDDWKVTPKLTLNLGLRYEYFQPYYDRHGNQAAFILTGPLVASGGTGKYLIPSKNQNVPLAPKFTQLLAKDNIQLGYSDNPSLITSQKYNFAPRIGFAFQPDEKSVVRGGFGLFYGGLESTGYYPNLGENYPFEFDSGFNAPTGCTKGGACPTNGFTLETGFPATTAAGLAAFINTPNLRGSDAHAITPYAEQYNLSVERSVSNDMVATVSYVGTLSRHLQVFPNPNSMTALAPNGYGPTPNPLQPFPDFSVTYTSYTGSSNYNSLQTKLERRFHNGLNFLASYTWSHALDNAPTPLGSTGDAGFRGMNVVPASLDYASSPFDVRHRFTFNGSYDLPFGNGRKYANSTGPLDYVIGGWSTSLTFSAQTGEPFTVHTSNITSPSGANAYAIRIADPFKAGGTPDPSYTGSNAFTCPTKVRTVQNWYNPCSFRNPKASDITYQADGVTPNTVSGTAALAYLGSPRNQIQGPGYARVNMSLFKSFRTWREQNLQFRADAFNLLNTPAYGEPNNNQIGPNGGQITGARFFQSYTPDSRFFQFALKYNF
jgi:hypothetical protein